MLHQVSGAGGLGVVELVLGTGPVVAVVLWLLVAFSIGSWGIILYKLIQISRARRQSEGFIARITLAIPPRSVEKPPSAPTAWRLARVSCRSSW